MVWGFELGSPQEESDTSNQEDFCHNLPYNLIKLEQKTKPVKLI